MSPEREPRSLEGEPNLCEAALARLELAAEALETATINRREILRLVDDEFAVTIRPERRAETGRLCVEVRLGRNSHRAWDSQLVLRAESERPVRFGALDAGGRCIVEDLEATPDTRVALRPPWWLDESAGSASLVRQVADGVVAFADVDTVIDVAPTPPSGSTGLDVRSADGHVDVSAAADDSVRVEAVWSGSAPLGSTVSLAVRAGATTYTVPLGWDDATRTRRGAIAISPGTTGSVLGIAEIRVDGRRRSVAPWPQPTVPARRSRPGEVAMLARQLLREPDPDVPTWTVADQLGRLSDSEALDVLRTAATDPDSPGLLQAVRVLGEVGEPDDVDIVSTHLDDPNQELRGATVAALAELARRHEITTTIELEARARPLLLDEVLGVRQATVRALRTVL